MGASVSNIITLISQDFVRLILLASLIATPFAYFLMKNWLHEFAYQITIHWAVFFGSGLLVLLIAFIATFSLAYKAATVNPANVLRNE